MAGIRRGGQGRFSAIIWPGFVDAMAGLLMIVMFVLTIFVVVQSVMRDRITSQDARLDEMGAQVAQLGRALGLAQGEGSSLRQQLAAESAARAVEAEQAARTIAEQAEAAETAAQTIARQQAEAEAATAQIAAQRTEIDAGAEAARLAAARREALEALIADLRRRQTDSAEQAQALATQLETTEAERAALDEQLAASRSQAETLSQSLSEAEAARLVDAAAAEALRERLAQSDAALSARDLALADARKQAEDTLTLLAAAEAARDEARAATATQTDEATRQAALLSLAQRKLSEQEALGAEDQRRIVALNAQLADLRDRLGEVQAVLDASGSRAEAAELRVEDLGAQLNAALLRTASLETERARAETARAEAETAKAAAESARAEAEAARASAEAEARARAEAEAQDLARYRSEFFGRLSEILTGREGVEVVGDRFVFSSEVLFGTGEAVLSDAGREQVRTVTAMLDEVAAQIPPGIDWVIRVDGHTDDQPLSGTGRYRDNWELSQARALAVVRYMVDELGFAPDRLVAAGFGQFRPVDPADTPEARARNRRIELKLTER